MSKKTPDYDFEQKTYGTSIWGEAFKRLLRNKAAIIGGIIFLCVVMVAVFADVIAPYGYEEQSLQEQYLPPFSENHIFGTDNLGRDIFSRVVYGARLSLSVGIVSVVLTAKWMGASDAVIISLAPKSVTTPIAMEVSGSLQGIPSLTAAIVVIVGLFGAVCGFKILQVGRVKSPIAQSISMGTASHAVGTSRAMEYGRTYGAYASLGLILNGLLTALFTPLILSIMGII